MVRGPVPTPTPRLGVQGSLPIVARGSIPLVLSDKVRNRPAELTRAALLYNNLEILLASIVPMPHGRPVWDLAAAE